MASRSSSKLSNCSSSDQGCCNLRRCLSTGRLFGGGEEAQSRDGVALPHAVEQIQRHDQARKRSEDREELGQR